MGRIYHSFLSSKRNKKLDKDFKWYNAFMKVAIVYTGIVDGFFQDTSNLNIPRVFDEYIENNLTHFINPIKEKYETDIYLTSYKNKTNDKVLEVLNPKKHQFIDYPSSTQITTYIKSMEMMLEENFDFMFAARFDLFYRSNVIDWNFDYQKFNVLFKEDNFKELNFTCDCLYGIPKKHLKAFIIALKQAELFHPQPYFRKNMHPVVYNFSKIMSKYPIHFLSNKYQITSEENAFFMLYRQKVEKYGHDYVLPDLDLPQNIDNIMFSDRDNIDRVNL